MTTHDATPPASERHLTDVLDRLSAAQRRLLLPAMALAAAVVAWVFRFVQDDAFITFRYSRHFADGNGLVLNRGDRVEGYTNFLWTWLMAIPERQGWSTPTFSILVTIALMVATIFVAHHLARLVTGDDRLALLSAAVLVANMSFVGYGTGGLETMLQTLLVTSVAALVLEPRGVAEPRPHQVLRRLAAGVVGALACLTRLDSAVLVGTWFVIVVVLEWRVARSGTLNTPETLSTPGAGGAGGAGGARRAIGAAALLGVPLVAILGPWLWWKYDYYGSILPNTLTAKSGGFLVPFLYGVVYLLVFGASYLAFLLIKRYRRHGRSFFANPTARTAFVPVVVWCVYTCVVGADFMEFRFMVPIIPILAILAAHLINPFTNVRHQAALVGVLLFASALHLVAPSVIAYPVLTFEELRHWPTESRTAWKGLGEQLADTFPGGEDVEGQPVVAVQPLGALSYYSELPTIDMLGLADREIAKDGLQIPLYYPGHVRMATVQQLLDKDVSLVVGLPTFGDDDPDRTSYRLSELSALYSTADLKELPDDATIVEAPLVPGRVWFMIYLTPNDKVDALIEAGEWRQLPIERTCRDDDLNVITRILAERTCDGITE